MTDGLLSFDLTRLNGDVVQYTIRPVVLREAIEIQNAVKDIVVPLIGEVSGVFQALTKGGALPVEAIQGMVATVNFVKLWDVSSVLFRGSVIRAKGTTPIYDSSCTVEIPDFDSPTAGYFVDNTAEWLAATMRAVSLNWPGFFSGLREAPGFLFRAIIPTFEASTE